MFDIFDGDNLKNIFGNDTYADILYSMNSLRGSITFYDLNNDQQNSFGMEANRSRDALMKSSYNEKDFSIFIKKRQEKQ
mgnify:CR=1 FL=1